MELKRGIKKEKKRLIFIGGYPKGLDFGVRLGTRSAEGREEFKRYFDCAIECDSAESQQIGEVAKEHGVYLVVGVVERDGGTLYCSVFFYGTDGRLVGKHRKVGFWWFTFY
jgi:nitrilase